MRARFECRTRTWRSAPLARPVCVRQLGRTHCRSPPRRARPVSPVDRESEERSGHDVAADTVHVGHPVGQEIVLFPVFSGDGGEVVMGGLAHTSRLTQRQKWPSWMRSSPDRFAHILCVSGGVDARLNLDCMVCAPYRQVTFRCRCDNGIFYSRNNHEGRDVNLCY